MVILLTNFTSFSGLPRLQSPPRLISRLDTFVKIIWDKYVYLEEDVNQYRIDCYNENGDLIKSVPMTGNSRSVNITELSKGTQYTINVTVVMEDGTEGVPSDSLKVTTCGGKKNMGWVFLKQSLFVCACLVRNSFSASVNLIQRWIHDFFNCFVVELVHGIV